MIWIGALILGIGGSAHCAFMCGPLVLAVPSQDSFGRFLMKKLTYNLGRIFTYVLLGTVFGVIGSLLNLILVERILSILVGIGMLLLVFVKKKYYQKATESLIGRLRKYLTANGFSGHFVFGLLNGLLPCGLTLFALIPALTIGNVLESMIYMLLFGLGTLPVMILLPIVGGKLKSKIPRLNYKVMVGVIGTLLILRSMNLGIPYVSPVLDSGESSNRVEQKIDCVP